MYESVVERNLMNERGYTPYCGSNIPRPPVGNGCDNPRTEFDGEQFVCPKCGYKTDFPKEFIEKYVAKWDIDVKSKKMHKIGIVGHVGVGKVIIDSETAKRIAEKQNQYIVYENVVNEMEEYVLKNLRRPLIYPDVPKKLMNAVIHPVRNSKSNPKHSRNSLCPCESGLKFKRCCEKNNLLNENNKRIKKGN